VPRSTARLAPLLLAFALLGSALAQSVGVTFWRSFSGPAADAQEELVGRFNQSQSAIRVTAEFQGFYLELAQKLTAAIAARTLPDLVTLDTGLAVPYMRDGLLQPLDALLDGPNGIDRALFAPGMLEAGQLDGVQYLIPFAISVPVIYFNPALLAAAGYDAPPATWDELFEQARAVTAHHGAGTFGLTYERRFWWLQSQIWTQGGPISDADHATYIDDPVWIAHLTELQALAREGVMNQPPRAAGGITADLASGRAAMMIASSAQLANVLNSVAGAFELGVAHLPGGPAGKIVPLGGSGLVIPAGLPAERVEAAWTLLKYLVSGDANAYFSSQSGYVPVTSDAAAAMGDFLAANPLWGVAIDQLPYARRNSELHDTNNGQPVVMEAVERILANFEDPATVLADYQQRLEAALREEGLR